MRDISQNSSVKNAKKLKNHKPGLPTTRRTVPITYARVVWAKYSKLYSSDGEKKSKKKMAYRINSPIVRHQTQKFFSVPTNKVENKDWNYTLPTNVKTNLKQVKKEN